MPYEIRQFGVCKRQRSRCVRVCKLGTNKCYSNRNTTRDKAMKQVRAIRASSSK